MRTRYSRALLVIARLIYQITWQAWMKLARRSTIGALLARLRDSEGQIARLEEECRLLRLRMCKIPAGSRPYYPKYARYEILYHMQRWGLVQQETADAFQITPETVGRWLKEQQKAESNLVQSPRPVNRLSDLKRELVHRVKAEQGSWGTRKIFQVLVRLGVKLSRRSVQRILRERPRHRPKPRPAKGAGGRPVRAAYPLHAAMMDLTTVRIPLIREIWIGTVLDVFSRRVLAIKAWNRTPKASHTRSLLAEAIRAHGRPKYLISDQGTQFTAALMKRFLRRRGIRRRYGAVGRWQAVAVIDRFFGSLKREYATRWLLLLPLKRINAGLQRYALWYAKHRPHQGLQGRTPEEVFNGRDRRPVPETQVKDLRLVHFQGDRKLPVYQRTRAA